MRTLILFLAGTLSIATTNPVTETLDCTASSGQNFRIEIPEATEWLSSIKKIVIHGYPGFDGVSIRGPNIKEDGKTLPMQRARFSGSHYLRHFLLYLDNMNSKHRGSKFIKGNLLTVEPSSTFERDLRPIFSEEGQTHLTVDCRSSLFKKN